MVGTGVGVGNTRCVVVGVGIGVGTGVGVGFTVGATVGAGVVAGLVLIFVNKVLKYVAPFGLQTYFFTWAFVSILSGTDLFML